MVFGCGLFFFFQILVGTSPLRWAKPPVLKEKPHILIIVGTGRVQEVARIMGNPYACPSFWYFSLSFSCQVFLYIRIIGMYVSLNV